MLTRPSYLLRLEETALLLGAVALYWQMHFSWVLFAVLFLAPDLFMVGFVAGPKVGAAIYNFGHLVVWPVIAFAVGYGTGRSVWMAVGIIWFAHIALDRMLGFGLKYPRAFKDTHLQHLG
jgi:hypothetical protein